MQVHEVVSHQQILQQKEQSSSHRHIVYIPRHYRIARPPEPLCYTDVRSQVGSNRTRGPYYGLQRIQPIMLF